MNFLNILPHLLIARLLCQSGSVLKDEARILLLARLMGQYRFARWRLSSSVEVCNTPGRPASGFSRVSQAMTSCRQPPPV